MLSIPTSPPFHQMQPSNPRHKVQFARPGVPLYDRIESDSAFGDGNMAFFYSLADRIVAKGI